jgi:trehalose-6-phosphatase
MIQSGLVCFEEIEQRLVSAETCTLFLDFGATLAPIVSDPQKLSWTKRLVAWRALNRLPGPAAAGNQRP